MNFPENSILVMINPFSLVVGFIVIIFISIFSARKYRNTNDFKKSIQLSLLLAIIMSIIFAFFGVPLIVLMGYLLCDFIFTSWFSNYYFYH